MKSPLRVLMLEASADDAEIARATLAADGMVCEPLRVETRDDFVQALNRGPLDLILSDLRLPAFDGLAALEIAREKQPGTPFVFVSGTMGEDLAIEALKSGAADYVLKQRLARLSPAVRRALREFEELSARQGAEQAWRDADALCRTVFQTLAIGIAVLDHERRFIKTNEALRMMYGYDEEELSALTLPQLTHPDDISLDEELLAEMAAGGRASCQVEKRYRHRSGEFRWGRLTQSLLPAPDDGRRLLVVLLEDVSERKGLVQQLIASQKMEAAGRLAAGIAHDFNNILTVITGYAGLLLSRIPAHDPLYREIAEISAASERATALTRRLLTFSGQQVRQPGLLDLNAIVAGLDPMLRRVVGEEIELVHQRAHDLGAIHADHVEIEQVLLNLVINARDATGPGGRITITTANVLASTGRDAAPEGSVVLAVKDTGRGMDEATKARIFEPFFTTKEVGKGTGLGLWSVREIVEQSRGAILVESQAGSGSTFRAVFPRVRVRRGETRTAPPPPPPTGPCETVLVVDDDAALRELMQEILEGAGYRTVMAADGAQALRIVASSADPIHLLVTDVSLPGMLGTSLADHVAALQPDVRVLYVSGHSSRSVLGEGATGPRRVYLQKPFTQDQLLQTVRQVVDAPRKASIVVADEDPDIRKLLAEVLRAAGYRVFEASGGKQASEYVRREHIDLLLTDLELAQEEELNRFQDLRRQFPGLRVMAMAGGFGEQLLRIAKALGADHIISKPFETNVIREDIRRLLAR